ncbi:MAG: RIP metalloprotease RseP [Prevotellaceae bacterium]|jgi:regulator of sigma E protease|nr:RIP metalloprotease RseP [Prevotellaceae bacterium]
MEVLMKIVQLIASLSLLIVVHELGHYLFARLFKMRVDKFYLCYNPWFSIVRVKRTGRRLSFSWFSPAPPESWNAYPGQTEWGIGWLPFGGYCKIAGMVDESMDKEQLQQPPQPWEFRTHPAWQRMFAMVGGVLFNVLFAVLVYWGMLFTWGERYLANKDAAYGVHCDTLAMEMGFRHGDKILAIGGQPVERFQDIQFDLIRNQAKEATVIRRGDTVTFHIDERYMKALLNTRHFIFEPRIPFEIAYISDTSHNAHAGLRAGDRVVVVDLLPAFTVQDVRQELQQRKNQTVHLTIDRHDTLLVLPVSVDGRGLIGVAMNNLLSRFFPVVEKRYSFFAALPAGVSKGYTTIVNYVKELGLIFSPKTEAYKSLGSFITIANIFPGTWDWETFWSITAMLSIMLAVLNILPIPALDGGHLMFVLYEMITRRKPSEKALEAAQWFGFVILILLMAFAFGNDIVRNFF